MRKAVMKYWRSTDFVVANAIAAHET
jgi:hypothetical protein